MHTLRRYATCPKGMTMKKKERKDAYPKKVCHMSTRYVEKKQKRREKYIADIQEKNTRRERSYKGVHPLSTKNIPHTCTYLSDCMTHFYLDLVFDNNISKVNLPLCSYPKLHISLIRWQEKRRQQLCLAENLKQKE